MKKIFTLLVFSVFFVSCSTSFAENNKPIKAFNRVDFNSLLNQNEPSQNLADLEKKIINPTKQSLKTKKIKVEPLLKIKAPEPLVADGKTRGNYLGLNFLDVETSYFERSHLKGTTEVYISDTLSSSSYGLGLDYKYAFNFNDFFIAPGFLLEKLSDGSKNVHQNSIPLRRFQVKDRYGIKADFGYDFSKISPFITLGYAAVSYKLRTMGTDTSRYESEGIVGSNTTIINKGVKGSHFFGFGLKINYDKNTSLNVEYNAQRFVFKATDPRLSTYYLDGTEVVTNLKILKLGLVYKF